MKNQEQKTVIIPFRVTLAEKEKSKKCHTDITN